MEQFAEYGHPANMGSRSIVFGVGWTSLAVATTAIAVVFA